MNHNANSDKPLLKLVKVQLPLSKRHQEEEFDFGLETESTSFSDPYKTAKHDEDELLACHSFSSLLKLQSKAIKRILYYSSEIEFNLD
jgi:hypothetical protein